MPYGAGAGRYYGGSTDPGQYFTQKEQGRDQKFQQLLNMVMTMKQMGDKQKWQEKEYQLAQDQLRSQDEYRKAQIEKMQEPPVPPKPSTYREKYDEGIRLGFSPRKSHNRATGFKPTTPPKTPGEIETEAEARARGAGTGKFSPTTGKQRPKDVSFANKVVSRLDAEIRSRETKINNYLAKKDPLDNVVLSRLQIMRNRASEISGELLEGSIDRDIRKELVGINSKFGKIAKDTNLELSNYVKRIVSEQWINPQTEKLYTQEEARQEAMKIISNQ